MASLITLIVFQSAILIYLALANLDTRKKLKEAEAERDAKPAYYEVYRPT